MSPSPRERAVLTAPSGLLFDPDNGSFAYIPTGRCRRSTDADLLLFSIQIFMHTVHWPCLLCLDTRRRRHVLKDNDWHDVTGNFGMANSVGPGDVQLLWSTSGSWCLVWRLVEGRSSNSLAQSWHSKRMFRPPLRSLLLGFDIVVRSFHAHSFSAEVLR